MNIAVLNYSGTVGKTTLVRHLLSPNLPDHTILAVESINIAALAPDTLTTTGRKSGKILDELNINPSWIFDVGGSNIEGFMTELRLRSGVHQDIDLFVVPVISQKKVQGDTINIIADLADLGIPGEKIKVVFNQVDPADGEQLKEDFGMIYSFFSDKGPDKRKPLPPRFTLSEALTVFKSEIFGIILHMQTPDKRPLTVYDLANDPTDYKKMVRDTADPDQKHLFARQLAAVRLAKGVKENFDSIFAELISTKSIGAKE